MCELEAVIDTELVKEKERVLEWERDNGRERAWAITKRLLSLSMSRSVQGTKAPVALTKNIDPGGMNLCNHVSF
jgi:hypothetical protein